MKQKKQKNEIYSACMIPSKILKECGSNTLAIAIKV